MTTQAVMSGAKAHIEQLEKTGYCLMPQVFSKDQVAKALELTKKTFEDTKSVQSDRMPFLNRDQPMVYNLQAKHPFFLELLFSNPMLEDILKHFLNDRWFTAIPEGDPNYILRSYLARSSGHKMPMHIDSLIPYTGPCVFVMQAAIILEDQDEDSGCTVVVPGSHLSGEYTNQEAFDTAVPLRSKAGDLAMWDSRLWHGALENRSGRTRWSMIATFQRWWLKQAFDVPGNLPQEIYDGLTNAQKAVLGYCSVPYDNETFGIDMKRSYKYLPKKVADYRR
jgi:ectoine hydroxylase-related dioxygenase (phytanoyl-CoA dioxygenase family)